jgi:uncharacterized membrane protein YuzA (DUF378 family)
MTGGARCGVCKAVDVLVALAALNWGLLGVFDFEPVMKMLGDMTTPARVVYGVLGLAGVLKLLALCKCCPCTRQPGGCGTAKS